MAITSTSSSTSATTTSSLDVASIVSQLMTAENKPINTLNKEQDNLQTRLNKIQDNYIAQYSGLNALLFQLNSTSTNLGNALNALNNMSASK